MDLNLLRVFAVAAECGSVTEAARRLYLTQPAVSAALRRLTTAVGAPLFVRQGRGLVPSARGVHLLGAVRVHLPALLDAALSSESFDPRRSERTFRLGLADSAEVWLLPALLRELAETAPAMKIMALPVQFRSVGGALANGDVELALTVADELPAGIQRKTLSWGDFVCLLDPRQRRALRPPGRAPKPRGKTLVLSETEYFDADHVIVSYNADLRGIVEDFLGRSRKVRCSLTSFANIGAVVEHSRLFATVPRAVAAQICAVRPALATSELPFELDGAAMELLWPKALEDDAANRFLRETIARLVLDNAGGAPPTRRRKNS